ncbi:MAG: hypothetical protein HUJ22_02490 [Gracilimonas sp.]|uniref:hypothetical protein n=1 Tax=Gracilimonas sp. TaxID=1974203 RepID=UPI0019B42391|nr:hypothetical protein [Gracilimonas sp.]MBD3615413.1 hypothetical protein [Gracilimonas sp.]
MNKKLSKKIIISNKVTSTNDIHKILDEIQEELLLLNISKAELTVLLTSISEVYRLFLNIFKEIHTTISSLENSQGIGVSFLVKQVKLEGSKTPSTAGSTEVKKKAESKLTKIKTVYDKFIIESDNDNLISLTLEKWFNESGIDHYINKN